MKFKNFKFVQGSGNDGKGMVWFTDNDVSTNFSQWEHALTVITPEFVVIDIDEQQYVEVIEKLIQAGQIQNTLVVRTGRGLHLYYKQNPLVAKRIKGKQVKIPLACGIEADFLMAKTTNEKITAMIKQDNVPREIITDFTTGNGEIDCNLLPELPVYFYPLKDSNRIDLLNLGDGEGRNEALFKQRAKLIGYYPNIDNELVEEFAKFINENIFSVPLDDSELSQLVRVDDIDSLTNVSEKTFTKSLEQNSNDFMEKGKVVIDRLVNTMFNSYYVVMYKGVLYMKKKGILDAHYESYKDKLDMARLLADEVMLNENQVSELMFKLSAKATIIEYKNGLPIRTRNGYELSPDLTCLDFKKVSVTDNNFTMYNLDVDYNPNAYDEKVDKFLNHVANNDLHVRMVIEEMLGHCLYTANVPEYAYFIISNQGRTGKTTFLKSIINLFGEDIFASNFSMEQIQEKNNIIAMGNKLVNIGDDLDSTYLETSGFFKKIVSGAPIAGRSLYKESENVSITTTLIMSANKMPKFKDVSGGIERRVIIIPCKNRIKLENLDVTLADSLNSDNGKSYLLNLAIAGRKRLIKHRNLLTYSEVLNEEITRYLNANNIMRSFAYEYEDSGDMRRIIFSTNDNNEIKYIHAKSLYEKFQIHCTDLGVNQLAYKTFLENLKEMYNIDCNKKGEFSIFNELDAVKAHAMLDKNKLDEWRYDSYDEEKMQVVSS